MAKKKKKKEVSDFLWFANYNPGLVPTHFTSFPQGGRWQYSYSIRYDEGGFTPSREYVGGAVDAFYEYTFGGPVSQMAGKSATQAGIIISKPKKIRNFLLLFFLSHQTFRPGSCV